MSCSIAFIVCPFKVPVAPRRMLMPGRGDRNGIRCGWVCVRRSGPDARVTNRVAAWMSPPGSGRLGGGEFAWRLDVDGRHARPGAFEGEVREDAVEPRGEPPVGPPEDAHGRWYQEHAHERGVNEDRRREADAEQ